MGFLVTRDPEDPVLRQWKVERPGIIGCNILHKVGTTLASELGPRYLESKWTTVGECVVIAHTPRRQLKAATCETGRDGATYVTGRVSCDRLGSCGEASWALPVIG